MKKLSNTAVDLITNVNEDDLKDRAQAFADDEDDMKPLVIGDTYTELFDHRKAPKDRKPIPTMSQVLQVKSNFGSQQEITQPPQVPEPKPLEAPSAVMQQQ